GSGRPSDAEASDRRRRQALHSAGERAGEAGLMIRAEQWLSALIGEDLFSPDVVSYNTVIHAYARTGNVDRAEFWLQQMVKANLVPNEDHHLKPNDICYNAVIKACVNCRSFQRAEVWMLRMRREGFALTPMTYNLFIHGCAQAGDLTLADKYLNEMIKEGCEGGLELIRPRDCQGRDLGARQRPGEPHHVQPAAEPLRQPGGGGASRGLPAPHGLVRAGAGPGRARRWQRACRRLRKAARGGRSRILRAGRRSLGASRGRRALRAAARAGLGRG
ncbi:unnamed protein product, partial [Prorocentrum cordatum]